MWTNAASLAQFQVLVGFLLQWKGLTNKPPSGVGGGISVLTTTDD